MSRDHRELRVFQQADELAVAIYRTTSRFPSEERYGLQSQLRRAMVSVAANIVEGCARSTERDYLHFIVMSLGSASETAYLFGLAHRLGYITDEAHADVAPRLETLVRSLQRLKDSIQEFIK